MEQKSLKDTRTRENLMKAFAGESMARNRYCIFASVAEKEGLIEIANIFRMTALNEKEHAEIYFKFLDGEEVQILNAAYPSCFGDTRANLMCAAKYEEEEHSLLYPEFGTIAEEEGFKVIAAAFFNIATTIPNATIFLDRSLLIDLAIDAKGIGYAIISCLSIFRSWTKSLSYIKIPFVAIVFIHSYIVSSSRQTRISVLPVAVNALCSLILSV